MGGRALPGAAHYRADLDAPAREGLLDARRPFSRASVQLLAPSPQLLVQLARLVQDTPQRLASSRGAQTLDRVLVRLPSLRLSARRCHALLKLALGRELLAQLRPQLLKLSVDAALIRPLRRSLCNLGWHTEDIVERIQLELVEVLVRRALHLQLPPVETLQRAGSRGWRGGRGVVRQRGRRLTSSIALECSPIPGACVSTFCIASAASQLSAQGGRASGLAARTQGKGRAAAERTVVECVDHVVHNPKGVVAVEGGVDLISALLHSH